MKPTSALCAVALLVACSPPDLSRPTYHDDIAPLLEQHCAECHAPGRVGGIEFNEVTTPALASVMLAAIKPQCDANGCRPPRMPPWLPGPESVKLLHDRSLSDDEVRLFERWAANPRIGLPEEHTPSADNVFASRPDDRLETAPYLSTKTVSDEQRCFVLHPHPGAVIAYRWRIDELAAVHHIGADVLVGADAKMVGDLDAADEQPGFDCSNGVVPGVPVGKLANSSIAPGLVTRYPEGTGVQIPAGAVLVIGLHVLPLRQKHANVTGVDLWYAQTPVRPVKVWSQLAPSDLACPPSMANQPQCQRSHAVRNAILGPGIPDHDDLVRQCGGQEEQGVESGQSFEITSRCLGPLPPGILRIVDVRIHAHTYTTAARLKAQRSDNDWLTLLDIPWFRWSWEEPYIPASEIMIRGMAELTCYFDNGPGNQWSAITGTPSDGPGIPPLEQPQAHILSLRQRDEMCQAIIQYVEMP